MNRLWLLTLLIWSSYGYSWICYYQPDSNGYIDEGSLSCSGIEQSDALENHWCVYYQPSDPVCQQFKTACVNSVEYETLSCPPNHSGGLQRSRNYICEQAAWSAWTTTSDNCTPNPPSCIETSDTRIVQCLQGFDGQITEQRIGTCPDPYGQIQYTEWLESTNTCVQSTTDPVSPISITSPVNPVSPIVTESVTVQEMPVPSVSPLPTPQPIPEMAEEVEVESTQKSEPDQEVKETKKEDTPEPKKETIKDLPKGKQELVHGFGLALSLELFNNPMNFYQPELVDPFSITQEFPIDESTRKFQVDLLRQSDIQDYYDSISNNSWERLRRGDLLQ